MNHYITIGIAATLCLIAVTLSKQPFFQDLYDSFKIKEGGFSARKASAFVGVLTAIALTFQFCNPEIVVEVLIVWLVFALLCLGIVTVADVIKWRNGNSSNTTPTQQ